VVSPAGSQAGSPKALAATTAALEDLDLVDVHAQQLLDVGKLAHGILEVLLGLDELCLHVCQLTCSTQTLPHPQPNQPSSLSLAFSSSRILRSWSSTRISV
jgi:hypothetical protein